MKHHVAAILAAVALASATATTKCNANNCARAVTGTRLGDAGISSHRADCSDFMMATVTPAPTTVTVTVTQDPGNTTTQASLAGRQVTAIPSIVPSYASACTGIPAYISACSCWGITAATTTAATPTATVTTTVPATCLAGSERCSVGGDCQDLLSDANNCGACGTVCVSGKCENGVCSTAKCNGSQCNSLNNCGENCFCFETANGDGFCGPGTSCAPLADCQISADCPQGEICATGTCCGRNVCLGPQGCENGVGISERALFGRAAELWTNGDN